MFLPPPAGRAFALLLLIAALGAACGDGGEAAFQLVFQSDRGGADDIYLMRDDGANVRRLTDAPGRDYEPDSSPDGQTLVFVSDRSGEGGTQLYLMNVDGSDVRRLTFSGRDDATVVDDYPHWSPDGSRIVFQRTKTVAGRADADIWLIDLDTGGELQLTDTPNAWDSTPSFATDGDSVLFESNRDGDFDIHRLDLATREVAQLTDEDGTDLEAKPSPDGTQIAFASDRDGDFELYVMDIEGGNVRQLTDNEAADRCPHWSPDGARFAFYSERDGNREVYVMQADGSDQRRLTDDPGRDEVPEWLHEG